jgi:hypothetical protein
MPSFNRTALAAFAMASLMPVLALASSDDAWEEMRADMTKKCVAAAADSIEAPRAVVDPFGAQTYGLALIIGQPKGAEGTVTHICVYDKRAKTVELGGELTEEMIKGGE